MFTKSSVLILKNLGKIITILFLPTFLASSVSRKPFSGVLTCEDAYSEEIYAVAMVVWKEARSEPEDGKRMVVQVIRNRAKHYRESVLKTTRRGMAWGGRIEPDIVDFVAREMKKEICHNFRYWIQMETSTDVKWKEYASKQYGVKIGNHFFF